MLQLLSPYPPGWGGTLLTGAAATLAISAGAYLIGIVIGMAGALGKLSGNRGLETVLNLYTTLIRSVPELILIVGLYYAGTDGLNRLLQLAGLPVLEVNGFIAAVAVLGFVQGAYMTEVAFMHTPSRTLVLTDLIENFEPEKTATLLMRFLIWAGGVRDPDGCTPRDMRLTFLRNKAQVKAAVETMIDWNPERVIIAHGRWYDRNGGAELRRAFRWILN